MMASGADIVLWRKPTKNSRSLDCGTSKSWLFGGGGHTVLAKELLIVNDWRLVPPPMDTTSIRQGLVGSTGRLLLLKTMPEYVHFWSSRLLQTSIVVLHVARLGGELGPELAHGTRGVEGACIGSFEGVAQESVRGLPATEAARPQTFPHHYAFQGGIHAAYGHIRNVVPCNFAHAFAQAVAKVLKDAAPTPVAASRASHVSYPRSRSPMRAQVPASSGV